MLRTIGVGLWLSVCSVSVARAVEFWGAGARPCITVSDDRAKANSGQDTFTILQDEQWVEGFISAGSIMENVAGFGGASSEVVFGRVEALCSLRPEWSLAKAAGEVFDYQGKPPFPVHVSQ